MNPRDKLYSLVVSPVALDHAHCDSLYRLSLDYEMPKRFVEIPSVWKTGIHDTMDNMLFYEVRAI